MKYLPLIDTSRYDILITAVHQEHLTLTELVSRQQQCPLRLTVTTHKGVALEVSGDLFTSAVAS